MNWIISQISFADRRDNIKYSMCYSGIFLEVFFTENHDADNNFIFFYYNLSKIIFFGGGDLTQALKIMS